MRAEVPSDHGLGEEGIEFMILLEAAKADGAVGTLAEEAEPEWFRSRVVRNMNLFGFFSPVTGTLYYAKMFTY